MIVDSAYWMSTISADKWLVLKTNHILLSKNSIWFIQLLNYYQLHLLSFCQWIDYKTVDAKANKMIQSGNYRVII